MASVINDDDILVTTLDRVTLRFKQLSALIIGANFAGLNVRLKEEHPQAPAPVASAFAVSVSRPHFRDLPL